MDIPPEPPPSYEQAITRKLVQCGLSAQGLSVSYADYLQSYEIVISRSAKGVPTMFACIHEVAGNDIVTIVDTELSGAYDAYLDEAYRPTALANAEAELAKRGLLKGFPKRADFPSETLFAAALEVHCGLEAGEAIRIVHGFLAFHPPINATRDYHVFEQRYSSLLAALQLVSAKGEMKFVFIGNEAVTAPD